MTVQKITADECLNRGVFISNSSPLENTCRCTGGGSGTA
jgi:hypothetical protein